MEDTQVSSSRPVATPREVWRAAKAPVLIVGAVVVAGLLLAILGGNPGSGTLYPDSAQPPGGRALAQLLRQRGVSISRTPSYSGTGHDTVFVPDLSLVDPDNLTSIGRIAGPADVVLVAPENGHLDQLQLPWLQVRMSGGFNPGNVEPACSLPEAATAGVARTGGATYTAEAPFAACYSRAGLPSLVVFENDGVRVTIVGTDELFRNSYLDKQGNAALALGLLSRHDHVEWLQPKLSELGPRGGDGSGDSVTDLLPRGVKWAVLQLFVAALFAIAWRARRLGPVVTEPLPIVVRAAEAVEGRARLYEAGHARERAAAVLRTSVRMRVARRLGLAPDAEHDAVVPVVAARAHRQPATVDQLLYGPPPADDDALVRLADELDSLDREVR